MIGHKKKIEGKNMINLLKQIVSFFRRLPPIFQIFLCIIILMVSIGIIVAYGNHRIEFAEHSSGAIPLDYDLWKGSIGYFTGIFILSIIVVLVMTVFLVIMIEFEFTLYND